jgi:hypothetical protein
MRSVGSEAGGAEAGGAVAEAAPRASSGVARRAAAPPVGPGSGAVASATGSATAAAACPGAAADVLGVGSGVGAEVADWAGFSFGFARDLALGLGSSTAALTRWPGTACPPDARRRGTASSGTAEEAVRPPRPISSRAAITSLLVTPSSFASS